MKRTIREALSYGYYDPYDILLDQTNPEGSPEYNRWMKTEIQLQDITDQFGETTSWYDSSGHEDWAPDIKEALEKGWRIIKVSDYQNITDWGLVFDDSA